MILDCNHIQSALQVFGFGLTWLGLWTNVKPFIVKGSMDLGVNRKCEVQQIDSFGIERVLLWQ